MTRFPVRSVAVVAIGAVGVASAGALITYLATMPDTGTVVGKDYEPAYSTVTVVSTGKTTSVIPEYHPECYELELRNGDRDGYVCVAPLDWERTHLGDYWGKR